MLQVPNPPMQKFIRSVCLYPSWNHIPRHGLGTRKIERGSIARIGQSASPIVVIVFQYNGSWQSQVKGSYDPLVLYQEYHHTSTIYKSSTKFRRIMKNPYIATGGQPIFRSPCAAKRSALTPSADLLDLLPTGSCFSHRCRKMVLKGLPRSLV